MIWKTFVLKQSSHLNLLHGKILYQFSKLHYLSASIFQRNSAKRIYKEKGEENSLEVSKSA